MNPIASQQADLDNSLFDQRVFALETKVSEFNQISKFAEAVSLILGIVDNYLASKIKEEVNVAVQIQSNKLKEEAEAENQEFFDQDKSDDEEKMYEEEDDDVVKELYGDLNITQGLRDADMTNVEQRKADQQNASYKSGFVHEEEDAHVTLTNVHVKTEGTLQSSFISSDFMSKLLNLDDPSSDINSLMDTSTVPLPPPPINPYPHLATITPQPTPDSKTTTTNLTISLPEIPNFASLFQFDQRIKEEVNVAVQIQSNKLKEEAEAENQEFFDQVDSTMKAIIKEKVKAQVSKIMPQIEKYVTESPGAKVLILIDKMETNELINRSDIQRNIYNALVESYNTEKDTLSTYEEPKFKAVDTEIQQDQKNESGHIDDQPDNKAAPKHDWFQKSAEAENQEFFDQVDSTMKAIIKEKVKAQVSKIMPQIEKYVTESPGAKVLILIDKMETNELINRSDIQRNIYNALVESYNTEKDTLSTYGDVVTLKRGRDDQDKDKEPSTGSDRGTKRKKSSKDAELSKGSKSKESNKPLPLIKDQGRQVVPADCFINNDLEYLKGGSSSSKYATSTTRTNATKFITVTTIKVMRWYDYGDLEEIVVRRDDNVLYKFKDGDLPRLNMCDIEDMLLLLVQKKLSNLDIDDQYDLGVTMRMFTRRVVILHRVKDIQLRVESYQKKLNITRPETFRSDIPNMIPYTAYKNPQGIIYQDKF
uniref:Uncharacterized protein n=1 Tax=Tanacetum cinerariifolium TaxID=118510 RepID=A0A6L2LJ51_TANCI|nr:hypothetical protein [Tanacetum cinerariifolium]